MSGFRQWMASLFKRFGWHGAVPSGTMPPDNTESFDASRQPEQYAEFADQRSPNQNY